MRRNCVPFPLSVNRLILNNLLSRQPMGLSALYPDEGVSLLWIQSKGWFRPCNPKQAGLAFIARSERLLRKHHAICRVWRCQSIYFFYK